MTLNLAAVHYNQGRYKKALQVINRMDYDPDHDKYMRYLTAILKSRGNASRKDLNNPKIGSVIDSITKVEDWLLEVYQKSLDEHTFRFQVIDNAIYTLRVKENLISLQESKLYRKNI